jgi:hypothetical protein
MEFQLQKLVAEIIEFICLSVLRICVYLFFIQKIWAYILIILGPIAIGMALIPGFENSLYSWVSKFINIISTLSLPIPSSTLVSNSSLPAMKWKLSGMTRF